MPYFESGDEICFFSSKKNIVARTLLNDDQEIVVAINSLSAISVMRVLQFFARFLHRKKFNRCVANFFILKNNFRAFS